MFENVYKTWLQYHIDHEKNPRTLELLKKGLGHGTIELLRSIWYPAIGNLDHLYPEFEVRDFNNGCRYIDLVYRPGRTIGPGDFKSFKPSDPKGCIEIHGYRSHARDIEISRFKDLCMKQALLVLDDWIFLPIAYLSITDDPEMCKQMVLAFVGKFMSISIQSDLDWAEAETLRLARRLIRPFSPSELAVHLRLSERHTRRTLNALLEKNLLIVNSGKVRYRTYQLS